MTDTFDLQRFRDAQEGVYPTALAELRAGKKRTHWMWFIFPQVSGLGSSPMAVRYAIASEAVARAYLADETLGPRLTTMIQAMLAADGEANDILGYPDDAKFRSSLTLFATVAEDSIFHQALDRFFDGQADELTLAFLRGSNA